MLLYFQKMEQPGVQLMETLFSLSVTVLFGEETNARQAFFAVTVAPVSGRRVGINFRPGCVLRSVILFILFFLRAVVMRCVPMFWSADCAFSFSTFCDV